MLESWDPPRFKLWLRRTASVLAVAAVVIFTMATKTELAQARIRATMVASSSAMPKAAPWRLLHPVCGEVPG